MPVIIEKDDAIAMKVVHIQRRQPPDKYSMEGYFSRVRDNLRETVDVSVHVLPQFSHGLFRRIQNVLSAWRNQQDINHVTGDIHYATFLLRRSRTLLTVHDCEILERLSGWKRTVVKLLWYTLPAKRVAAMTVNSEETKRQLLKVIRFPESKVRVVPVSVSALFQPSPQPFDAECPRILQVGTKANKNLPRLIEAVQGLKCRLDIIGTLSESQLRALKDGQIQFENFVNLTDEEIVERYRQADIVSFVSTHEGFGMPIVEAQSVERVCVTSNCSSMPEVAGQGACLVDPHDVASIREGILKVINDSDYRNSLVDHGRTNKARFDAEKIAADFLEVYRSMLPEADRSNEQQ